MTRRELSLQDPAVSGRLAKCVAAVGDYCNRRR